MSGVDLTGIDAIGVATVEVVHTEYGRDLSRFPTEKQFVPHWRPNGIAEVPLTELALEAFRDQLWISGTGIWLFPSDKNPRGHQKSLKTVWQAVLRRAKVPYFRIYNLRSTYATRLTKCRRAGRQLLGQGNAKVFKKYSLMKTADEEGGPSQAEPQAE